MSESPLRFVEATLKKLVMRPGSDDAGYSLKNTITLASSFTRELAEAFRCADNFFDADGNWRDGVTNAGLPVVLDGVRLQLFEQKALKKADPLLEINPVSLESLSVFDEGGSPRISFNAVFEQNGGKVAAFLDKRKFYHGDVVADLNQATFDFGTSAQEAAEDQEPLPLDAPAEGADIYLDGGAEGPVSTAVEEASGKKSKPKKADKKESAPKKGKRAK